MARAAARATCVAAFLPALVMGHTKAKSPFLIIEEQEGGEPIDPRLAVAMAARVASLEAQREQAEMPQQEQTADDGVAAQAGDSAPEDPAPAAREEPAAPADKSDAVTGDADLDDTPARPKPKTALTSAASGVEAAAMEELREEEDDLAAPDVASRLVSAASPLVSAGSPLLAAGETDAFKAQRAQADAEQRALEASSNEAASSMLGGSRLRRTMARRATDITADERKLHHLEREGEHLNEEQASSERKLQDALSRRMTVAETRLKHRRELVEKAQGELSRYRALKEQHKATALSALEQRKAAQENFEGARRAAEEAERAARVARRKYEGAREWAAKEVEALKVADAKERAVENAEQEEEAKEQREEASVARISEVYNAELSRLKQDLSRREHRVEERMEKVAMDKSAAEKMLTQDQERYAEWQQQQRGKRQDLQARATAIEEQRQAMSRRRSDLVHAAQARAAARASASQGFDSDDWAWSGAVE